MALAADPSVISLAGGIPGNSLFPIEAVDEIYAAMPAELKRTAFQYGPTSGYPPLIESLRGYLASRGLPVESNELLVTTGAQQAINLLTQVFVDPGDAIITEYPSFIGALAAFKARGAELLGVDMDNDGIKLDTLAEALGPKGKPEAKLLYLCPCFHNPAGITYSLERKRALLEMLRDTDVVLIEDDPYSELYFDEADKPLTLPMKAMGKEPVPIAYVGSFAKIFGPGMRLGWLLAPPEIVEKVGLAKQSADACSPTYTQVLAHLYLSQHRLPAYLSMVREAYRARAQAMLETLEWHMPEGVTWSIPRGGFYVWVRLPSHIDASAVFNKAIDKGAAFVIGSAFDPAGTRNDCFRLAFSHPPEDVVAKGTKSVCDAVRECV